MQDFYLTTEVITGCGTLGQLGKQAARFGHRRAHVCGRPFAQRLGCGPRPSSYGGGWCGASL
jgi:alcohol dehydrogenase class IV